MQKVRCAIYTRKSSEDGLEQEFNSLHAQREACEAYITSQKHEGWVCLEQAYDDGGLSGGNLERHALKRLLADIDAGLVDQVVVYKIDRLTRSLTDFSKIVDVLDRAGASFVSVTQSFNTATSMGRLTLNMLLSFAQFEREVTAERIRDKIAASKRKGLWMGGNVPLGYRPNGRTLTIHAEEAETIRALFDLYLKTGGMRQTKLEADKRRLRTAIRTKPDGSKRGGDMFSIGHIHHILTNPIYAGKIRHKDKIYEGQHDGIIDHDIWDRVQDALQENAQGDRLKLRGRSNADRKTSTSPLLGKLYDDTGDRMSPSHTKARNGTRLRYYISHRLTRGTREEHPDAWRLPADEFEKRLGHAIKDYLTQPATLTSLLDDQTSSELRQLQSALKQTGNLDTLALVDSAAIETGTLAVQLDVDAVAALIDKPASRMRPEHLGFSIPFQQRKRGVETRLILGGVTRTLDITLLKNVALGQKYLSLIKQGLSYTEITEQEATSKRMVQNLIEYAFLAPDIVDQICEGEQPLGLTSEWLKQNVLPASWTKQREMIVRL